MIQKKHKPEWAPEAEDDRFTSNVLQGVEGGHDGIPGKKERPGENRVQRKVPTEEEYVQGVMAGDRTILARTITLIESNAQAHFTQSQNVLNRLLPHSGNSVRIGISGIPGAGKSTFIEAFGLHLIASGHRVAVLAIDPSSSLTRGSIMGDKTRMEKLSRAPGSFIRPSPSGGALGGVARKTRETILVCEAAGFDVILVETIGVGQSEIMVRSMVDFFLLLQIAGAGDELQGIKKGVIEIADAILVNKADGDNKARAEAARKELEFALHYIPRSTDGWKTRVATCSALAGEGIREVWETIRTFCEVTRESGIFQKRRHLQAVDWFNALIEEQLMQLFTRDKAVSEMLHILEAKVVSGEMTSTSAATKLMSLFSSGKSR